MNIKKFVELVFKSEDGSPIVLTPGQEEIINKIIYPQKMKTLMLTPTRYGKSFTIAFGAIIKACMFPGKKIRIVSATGEQSKIIQNYVIQHLFDNPIIYKMLAANKGKKRIQKELSKKKINFVNGSEISTLSADILNKGRQLMGHGATDLIVDETALIPDEIYHLKLLRMIGDSPDGAIFEITNPIKRNHAWVSWNEEQTDKLHIGYKQGIAEGRYTEKYINEMKRTLTPKMFKIMFEAEFPDELEKGQLYPAEWIRRMFDSYEREMKNTYYIGVDLAAEGEDLSVITIARESVEGTLVIEKILNYSKQDLLVTAGKVLQIIRQLPPQVDKIVSMDAIGMGKGAYESVKINVAENKMLYQNCYVIEFKSVRKAKDEINFHNVKSELAFKLYNLLQEDKIKCQVDCERLKFELGTIRETNDTKGRMKAVDPDDKLEGEIVMEKSPDFYDSLLLTINSWKHVGKRVTITAGGWK